MSQGKVFVRACPACGALHQTADQTAKTPCDPCVEKAAKPVAAATVTTGTPAIPPPAPTPDLGEKKKSKEG